VNFLLSEYGDFLAGLIAQGYQCLSFADPAAPSTTGKNLLLRHDIDIDPVMAIPMAKREHEVGARSTYYVLMSNRHTNPFDLEFRHAVHQLADLGHWIGLHFDATQYGLTAESENFNSCVQHEVELTEKILGVRMESVSFHRPSRDLIGSSGDLTAPLRHTYEPDFVHTIEYCSDSSGRWSYGPPEERSAIAEGRPFHLLTHPISWGHSAEEPKERIRAWISNRSIDDIAYEIPDR